MRRPKAPTTLPFCPIPHWTLRFRPLDVAGPTAACERGGADAALSRKRACICVGAPLFYLTPCQAALAARRLPVS